MIYVIHHFSVLSSILQFIGSKPDSDRSLLRKSRAHTTDPLHASRSCEGTEGLDFVVKDLSVWPEIMQSPGSAASATRVTLRDLDVMTDFDMSRRVPPRLLVTYEVPVYGLFNGNFITLV